MSKGPGTDAPQGGPAAPRIGASSWSAPSWEGPFYPPGTPPIRFLEIYAESFDTVEIDATFYRTPDARTVDGWRDRTPPGFLFAAKVPQTITHEKLLQGCGAEMGAFVGVMERLGDKLGPMLLQFRYFRKAEFPDPAAFIKLLEGFLPALPGSHRFTVEVRNRSFLTERLFDALRRHRVALAFIDHPWFPRIDEMMRKPAARTADFSYIRWLGDRKGIEKRTTTWDRLIIDRTAEMQRWIPALRTLGEGGRPVLGYFNNHYAGYAVGSIRHFRELWAGGAQAPPAPE